jgi:dTDP-4-dehydrorhamnose 3,5-epimerase
MGLGDRKMDVKDLILPGCRMLCPRVLGDERGSFTKTFVENEYRSLGLPTLFVEEYFTRSTAGVIRGLHFQLPPYEYAKLVACIYGKMKDVILDLRVGSPQYGQAQAIELDANAGQLLYLPAGIAHGFLSHTEVIVSYKVTARYVPTADSGIRWDSLPLEWGVEHPILSARDRSFPALSEFVSPFVYQPSEKNQ